MMESLETCRSKVSDEWVEEFEQKWTQEQAQDFDPNLFNDLANSNSLKVTKKLSAS